MTDNSIIRALRANHLLKRLVYVSCDPNIAIKNMVESVIEAMLFVVTPLLTVLSL